MLEERAVIDDRQSAAPTSDAMDFCERPIPVKPMKRLTDGRGIDRRFLKRDLFSHSVNQLYVGQRPGQTTSHSGHRLDSHDRRARGHEQSRQLARPRRKVQHPAAPAQIQSLSQPAAGDTGVVRPGAFVIARSGLKALSRRLDIHGNILAARPDRITAAPRDA